MPTLSRTDNRQSKTKVMILVLAFLLLFTSIYFATLPILKIVLHTGQADLAKQNEPPGIQHTKVPLSKVSKWMQLAILAAEDHRFYNHDGIDLLGLIRAGLHSAKAGHMVEGASTISQQLAKIAFLDQEEKTARRKFSQLVLATELEQRYSKEQILDAYLNIIYFGKNAYGIEDAAKTYFGVAASKLSLAQSAFLAGLVRAPSVLGDSHNLQAAVTRQHQVIDSMKDYAYISAKQAKAAESEKLIFTK